MVTKEIQVHVLFVPACFSGTVQKDMTKLMIVILLKRRVPKGYSLIY
jgi:hypothetical protein